MTSVTPTNSRFATTKRNPVSAGGSTTNSWVRPEARNPAAHLVAREILRFFLAGCLVLMLYAAPLLLFGNPSATDAAGFSLILVGLVTLTLTLVSPFTALIAAVLAAILQNVALGLLHSGNAPISVVISETKTVMILVFSAVIFLRSLKTRSAWVYVGLAAIFSLSIIGLAAGFDSSFAANARNFLVPFLLLLALAKLQVNDRLASIQLTVATCWLSVVLALGSLLEYSFGSREWKTALNVDALAGLNSLSEQTIVFGRTASRVGGFLVEPINAGYVASFALLYTTVEIIRQLARRKDRSLVALVSLGISAALLTLCITLAATKNSILVVATGVIAFLLVKLFSNHRQAAFWVSIGIGCVLTFAYAIFVKGPGYATAVWSDPVGASGGESTSIHIAGLLSGIYALPTALLGHGVGSGGNFYRLYHPEIPRNDWLLTGGESAIGTMIYQMGVVGIILVVLTVTLCLPRLTDQGAAMLSAWLAAALFSEATFGAIVAIPALMYAAYSTRPTAKSTEHASSTDASDGAPASESTRPSVLRSSPRSPTSATSDTQLSSRPSSLVKPR